MNYLPYLAILPAITLTLFVGWLAVLNWRSFLTAMFIVCCGLGIIGSFVWGITQIFPSGY